MQKLDIKSYTLEKLEMFFTELAQPKFRAKQVFEWLHAKKALNFQDMTSLSKHLREQLDDTCYINRAGIKKKQVSQKDGTIKFLFELRDGACIESVFMRYKHGDSLCISTQAGCRMGCGFCASTLGGLQRNLTAAEMLDQIYAAELDTGRRVTSVVLMGIGEPLDNFDNVLDFLDILSSPHGYSMSLRHVSLSTCGLVDKIDGLAEKKLPLTLSVSLHAPSDTLRSSIMPINNKWGIDELLAACARYFKATGRRISFEYAMIGGVNDSREAAQELGARLKGLNCHVNLIPVNAVEERGHTRSKPEMAAAFLKILENAGINATVRRELGSDISAACGQLRRESAEKDGALEGGNAD